jgi:topoisomerase-4 subunit A
MDVSEYDDGRGRVRLRCKIEEKNPKTVVIKEICAATTTESLIASIEDAAKKGKIKIDAIHDYTSDEVEIEVHLPRGTYAKDTIEQLYAFTDCEVSISSQMVVIVDGFPKLVSVTEAIEFYAKRLKWCLQKELEIELEEVKRGIFYKTLERIFIEKKIYQSLEKVDQFEKVYGVLSIEFEPYHKELIRLPEKEDFEALLKIPIRRIAKFDRDKNSQECKALEDREAVILKSLGSLTKYTIRYLQDLIKRYGEAFPRRTRIKDLEVVDRRSMQVKQIEIGVDKKKGYVGTAVKGEESFSCTNFDKILILLSDGTYKVVTPTDRAYLAKTSAQMVYCGVADKKQVFTACYRDPSTGLSFCKRFIVKKFIIDREYRFIEEGHDLLLVSEDAVSLFVQLVPKPRQRVSALQVESTDFPIKGVSAKGNRLSRRPVMAVRRGGGGGRAVPHTP